MVPHMDTKVLENNSVYESVKSQDGRHSVQFLTVRLNHDMNRDTLSGNKCKDI